MLELTGCSHAQNAPRTEARSSRRTIRVVILSGPQFEEVATISLYKNLAKNMVQISSKTTNNDSAKSRVGHPNVLPLRRISQWTIR